MLRSWKVWAARAVAGGRLFGAAMAVVGSVPPKSVQITSGAAGSAYDEAAAIFAAALEAEGIAGTVTETASNSENLARQHARDDSAVEIGLIQSGVATLSPPIGVVTLGVLFVEPT